MRNNFAVGTLLFVLAFTAEIFQAQAQFFRFKIKDQGVYKLSATQASDLGFSSLSEVSVYGYPGMLPQKLDSAQLRLQEIPALESDGSLYFFLSGPNILSFSPEGLDYSHHLFADSLGFLLGKNKTPRRIAEKTAELEASNPDDIWYNFTTFKAEQTNLLNSGRVWYSTPIRQGQSLNINLSLPTGTDSPWILHGKLMAQSHTESTMRVLSGNELLGEVSFSPIPNSAYGIKGREESFDWMVTPKNPVSQIRVTFQGSGSASSGYLNYLGLGVPFSNAMLEEGIYESEVAQKITMLPSLKTWEISDFFNPVAIDSKVGKSASGKKWVIFSAEKAPEIKQFTATRTDLRSLTTSPELLIISPPPLLSSANKLGNFKQAMGINSLVVTTEEIYESFGYGNRDLTAIRNFIAFVYHSEKKLKNVLILGKGTFDYKGKLGGRPNLVPIYSSRESLNPLATFSSDDYLALIGWGQGQWKESREGDELMQIGIGRLPAINYTEANEMVEKIIRYESNPIRTPKSSTVTFLVDDGDNNIHIRDAEAHSEYLATHLPDFQQSKLYVDRFEQEKSGSGQHSSQAKSALQETLEQGTLILNFIGHGNETTLTAEEVFRVEDLADWPKQEQLALWITATCEFGRHDSPFIRSAAEELLFAKEKGAVGLLTTGRPVFSSLNFSLNKAFIEEVFQKKDGRFQDLGEIFKNTKNKSMNGALNRNFSLLADPSLRLALPELEIKVTSMEDGKTGDPVDTLKAFQEILLQAEVIDPLTKAHLTSFNGEFQIELRDIPFSIQTLGDESSPIDFEEENISIFNGLGKVESGRIQARFVIPIGINPEIATRNLRISAWDARSQMQAFGNERPLVGGAAPNESEDTRGPEISLSINGQSTGPFVFPTPNLDVRGLLSDSSGIHVAGFSSGQDLSIQVNDQVPIILNGDFLALDGNFQKGYFETFLKGLSEGKNRITIKAWDNVGNQSILVEEVELKGSKQVQILGHKVYPNPATSKSTFELSHNMPGENLTLSLEVYSLTGQILFLENFRLPKADQNIRDLSWSFLQGQTKYPAKGTYIYKLSLRSESDFTTDSVGGKLVIQ